MKPYSFIKNLMLFFLSIMLIAGCGNYSTHNPQTHIIEIKGMTFQPDELTVNKGDTVIWINKDIIMHDVTEENKTWASPSLASESSWKKVVTKNSDYYCSIHVVMKGKLTVIE